MEFCVGIEGAFWVSAGLVQEQTTCKRWLLCIFGVFGAHMYPIQT